MATTGNVELYSNVAKNSGQTTTNIDQETTKEEEKEEVKSNNLFGDLPQQETFIDVNGIECDQEVIDIDGTTTHRESLHLIYNSSSIDVWCFCFCIKSNKFPNLIEQCINKLKLRNDLFLKKKRQFGACRYITYSILIWIIISIFFGICLFLIVASISCIMDEYEWNNNILQEICSIKSYQMNSYTFRYHVNIINSTQCPMSHEHIFNLTNKCWMNDCDESYYNQTHKCWINGCDDNQIYFESPNFDHWCYGYVPYALLSGIILFCLGQCCIINIKQFCCNQLCGKL